MQPWHSCLISSRPFLHSVTLVASQHGETMHTTDCVDVRVQVVDSADKPLSRAALAQLGDFMQSFLAVSHDRLMGPLRKELEPGLSISRHPREVFITFLQLARLCTSVVRLRQVRLASFGSGHNGVTRKCVMQQQGLLRNKLEIFRETQASLLASAGLPICCSNVPAAAKLI